jgi:hypothetical protein
MQMFRSSNKWLFAATGISIFFALALSIFAGDVFKNNQTVNQAILDLLLHLIPTAIALILTVIAHRFPLAGAIIFAVIAIIYIITGWANLHWSAHVLIAGPLLLMSILYVIAYKSDK